MSFNRVKLAEAFREYLGDRLVRHDEWKSIFPYSTYPSSSPYQGPRFLVGHYNGATAQLPRIISEAGQYGAREAMCRQMRRVDSSHYYGNGWDHGYAYLFGVSPLELLIFEGRSAYYPHGAHLDDPDKLDLPIYQALGIYDTHVTEHQKAGHDLLWQMFADLVGLKRPDQRMHKEVQPSRPTQCCGPLYGGYIHDHMMGGLMPVIRLEGDNRYGTAAAVSKFKSSGQKVDVAVASGIAFADAVAASTLDVPVLLTDPQNLPPETAAEIIRMGATSIAIIGGEDVVMPSVEAELRNLVPA